MDPFMNLRDNNLEYYATIEWARLQNIQNSLIINIII